MRALLNGAEGGNITIMRGEEKTHILYIMNDDGTPPAVLGTNNTALPNTQLLAALVTADALQLVAYPYPDRSGTIIATFPSVTFGSETIPGKFTYPLIETDTASLVPNNQAYLFAKLTINTGGKIYWARTPWILTLR